MTLRTEPTTIAPDLRALGARSRRVLRRLARPARAFALIACAPAVLGAGGDDEGGSGCAALSESEAPDFEGTWEVEYDDTLLVEIKLGGAAYTSEIGLQGGTIEIEHEGQPLTFDLDCSRPDVVCPSEVWPQSFTAEHRNEMYPHQVIIGLPKQVCDGETVAADPGECGVGTDNPDCEDVCEGELVTELQDAFGVIDEPGERLEVLLGGGVASNGINCALLGLSIARADIVSNNPQSRRGWQAEALENGEVVTGYSGACLWADDVDMDAELEAVVLGAELRFSTGFTAQRD